MIQQTHSINPFQQDINAVETIKKSVCISSNKDKTLLKISYLKVKLFFWNLSPNHWFDDMKNIEITLEEFECEKRKINK